jgi:hypothetical protein
MKKQFVIRCYLKSSPTDIFLGFYNLYTLQAHKQDAMIFNSFSEARQKVKLLSDVRPYAYYRIKDAS